MIRTTLLIILFSACSRIIAAQTLLCAQESITVYYVMNKSEEASDYDEWKIYLDIENRSVKDLFYTRAYKNEALAFAELVPSFLTVRVLNGIYPYDNKINYVHGSITLHISADTLTMYKVSPKRYDKSIVTRTKKGEVPEIKGEFVKKLMPLDSIKKLRWR